MNVHSAQFLLAGDVRKQGSCHIAYRRKGGYDAYAGRLPGKPGAKEDGMTETDAGEHGLSQTEEKYRSVVLLFHHFRTLTDSQIQVEMAVALKRKETREAWLTASAGVKGAALAWLAARILLPGSQETMSVDTPVTPVPARMAQEETMRLALEAEVAREEKTHIEKLRTFSSGQVEVFVKSEPPRYKTQEFEMVRPSPLVVPLSAEEMRPVRRTTQPIGILSDEPEIIKIGPYSIVKGKLIRGCP
jgi:hypothetical protein